MADAPGGDTLKKLRYVRSFLQGKIVHTNLQLLYTCNFRCQICDFWKPAYHDSPRLSLSQVQVIADKLDEIGPQIVSVGGGEPLLHPELADIVRVLARRHFPVMICNGWFVTPENARALWEAGAYEVSISVDYADPARHDQQRGKPGAFKRALAALRILNEQRVAPWQRVHMISVVLDDNLDQVEPLIQLCRQMGITYLVTLYSDSRGTKQLRAVAGDVSHRLLELKRQYPEFVALRGYIAEFSRAIRDGGVGPCNAGRHLCNIDSQGNVTLCIDRLTNPVGNILVDDVRQLERRLREASRANTCSSCWTSCRGNIQSLHRAGHLIGNLLDYRDMTKDRALTPPAAAGARLDAGAP